MSATAQERYYAFSNNGHFVAELENLGKHEVTNEFEFNLGVFGVRQNAQVLEKSIFRKNNDILDFEISPSGRLVALCFEDRIYVVNVVSKKVILEENPVARICFPNFGNRFFVVINDRLFVRDCNSGDLIQSRNMRGWPTEGGGEFRNALSGTRMLNLKNETDPSCVHIYSSPQDDYIIASCEDWIEIVDAQTMKVKKRFSKVYNWSLDPQVNALNLAYEAQRKMVVQRYGFPSFKRLKKGKVGEVFNDLIDAREVNPRLGTSKRGTPKIRKTSLGLSPKGGYLMFLGDYEATKESELFVYDLRRDVIVGNYLFKEKKVDNKAAYWIREHLISIPEGKMVSLVFNVSDQKFEEDLRFEFAFQNDEKKRGKWRQILERILSPDQFYSVLPEGSKGFTIRRNNTKEEFYIGQKEFVGFSKDSKWGFFKMPNGQMGFFSLKELPALNFYLFDNDFQFFPEDEIPNDATPPSSYSYLRFNKVKEIQEAKRADSLKLHLKTVVSGNNSGIQVHLLDQNGNHYRKASATERRKNWCYVEIENGLEVKAVSDFIVNEVSYYDSLNHTICLLLDFSGSMGWRRAELLTAGAGRFIESKRKGDKISVVKYDDKIIEEIRNEKNADVLMNAIWANSFGYFGGATALLDASNVGINIVKGQKSTQKYSVILLTDGMENASFSSKNELIANAIRNGVNIYTVGFGDKVDNDFLKSISYSTGGGHYNIFSMDNFAWVFNDIYHRIENYYSISLPPKYEGYKIKRIVYCPDEGRTDSLVIDYEPTPSDLNVISKMEEYMLVNPLKSVNKQGGSSGVRRNYYELNKRVRDNIGAKKVSKETVARRTKIKTEFGKLDLPQFNFHHDQVVTLKGTEKRIDDLVAFMLKYPKEKLVVEGHTDNSGETDYNMVLSEQRAQRVKQLMVEKGANSERILTMGYGESKPIVPNNSKANMEKNRRVVFRLFDR